MPKLTVTVITRDEAANIEAALASVAWADEIVVVDCGSTDDTVAIARRHTSKVFVRDWPGFAAQKNWATEQASHDWILSIDADERVPSALASEIQSALAAEPLFRSYRFPRVSFYLGRWIRSTDWYPDYQLRLYDRRVARWMGMHVHESVQAEGTIGRLRQELQHLPYRDISDHLQTIDRYTTLSARQMAGAGGQASAVGLLTLPIAAFIRNYFLRGGWRDGAVGLIVSVLNSYYVFLKFAKLWEMRRDAASKVAQ